MSANMAYSTYVDKRTLKIPVQKIVNDEIQTIRVDEYPLNVLVVNLHNKLNSKDDVRELATRIYPEALDVLGKSDNVAGVEIHLEDVIKVLLHSGDSLSTFQKSVLREYVSLIELPRLINGGKGNTPKGM